MSQAKCLNIINAYTLTSSTNLFIPNLINGFKKKHSTILKIRRGSDDRFTTKKDSLSTGIMPVTRYKVFKHVKAVALR